MDVHARIVDVMVFCGVAKIVNQGRTLGLEERIITHRVHGYNLGLPNGPSIKATM